MLDIAGLWDPKANVLPRDAVVTYGSCFAQHIGKALRARGYRWLRTETPPAGLSEENRRRFNYDVFSARTGNIYTASLLRQWTSWATGAAQPPAEVWQDGDRWVDPFRPRIEPGGYASEEELHATRAETIAAFRRSITECRHFVFTLGLTESWHNSRDGFEYPMCPGTVGGRFDADLHTFVNQDYDEIRLALLQSFKMMRQINPRIRFILTVSPVPLTATMSGQHVLTATMHSKSILRAVAGKLASTVETVDYFPSYEIINSPVYRGAFFEPNQRSVSPHGVNHVMNTFFGCLAAKFGAAPAEAPASAEAAEPRRPNARKAKNRARRAGVAPQAATADEVCEEALLDAFGAKE